MLFLNKFIDATKLGPAVENDTITALAEDAQTHQYASICIPPYFIQEIKTSYQDISVGTVIGFPHGIATAEAKATQISNAIALGADELDIVVSLTAIQNDNLSYLEQEMKTLLEVKQNKVYKLILETALWAEGQLERIVKFYSQFEVEYLKTSTGFNGEGATPESVQILLDHKAPSMKVKASGGIKTYEQAAQYVEMGVERIGTSSPQTLLKPNT